MVSWAESVDEDRVYLSLINIAELGRGIEPLASGRRRSRVEEWLREELPQRFERRVLPIDYEIAETWGKLASHCESSGRPIGVMDGFLAATAMVHNLTLVSHNVSDFPALKTVLNPWTD